MKPFSSMESKIIAAKTLRDEQLRDPFRPGYHFALLEDYGLPGDPNGAFYVNGVYHLMYLYRNRTDGFRWGHVSSNDLFHWRHHVDVLTPDAIEGGAFSGGAFVDDDNTVYLTYWQLSHRFDEDRNLTEGLGIAILKSVDDRYEQWEKWGTIIPSTTFGVWETKDEQDQPLVLCAADPSNIWKSNGTYYLQTGNLLVMDRFGRGQTNRYSGDYVDLFESDDLKTWHYVHRFYDRNPSNTWTELGEDAMCPSFLPLPSKPQDGEWTDRYLQLFLSHNKGCQYYIGTLGNRRFHPIHHGRLTFSDDAYFAPEALIDDRHRQIVWTWFRDNLPSEIGHKPYSGVYALPRMLWVENDELRMDVVDEIRHLRIRPHQASPCMLENNTLEYEDLYAPSCEILVRADIEGVKQIGFRIENRARPDAYTLVYFDRDQNKLILDSTASGGLGRLIKDVAPLRLDGTKLELRLFLDHSVVEIFASKRQAISRRVFAQYEQTRVSLYVIGKAFVLQNEWFEMAPSNPY